MVRGMLADGRLPTSQGITNVHSGVSCKQSTAFRVDMQYPYKMLKRTADLRHLRVIEARVLVHIEWRTPKLVLEAIEGRLVE